MPDDEFDEMNPGNGPLGRALRALPARALPLPYSGLAKARAEWEGPSVPRLKVVRESW